MWNATNEAVSAGSLGTAWLEPVLDQMDYGIVVLIDGHAVCVNRAARRQLAEPGCPLCWHRGRLNTLQVGDEAAWQAALKAGEVGGRRQILTLRGEYHDLPLAVVPVDGSERGVARRALLVTMGKREVCSELTTHWFSREHRLTPAESRVLSDLIAGHPPREIAQRNGVALSTVRTQIAALRDKTATRGIRELLRAAATLPPVMPVVPAAPLVPFARMA